MQSLTDKVETPLLEEEQSLTIEFSHSETDISPENRRKSIIRTPNSTPRTRTRIEFKDVIRVVEFEKDSPTTSALLESETHPTIDRVSLLRNRKINRRPRISKQEVSSLIKRTESFPRPRDSAYLQACFAEVKRDQLMFNLPAYPAISNSLGTFEFSDEIDESLNSFDMDTAFSEMFNQPELPRKRKSIEAELSQNDEVEEGSPPKKSSSSFVEKDQNSTMMKAVSVTVVATEASSSQQKKLLEYFMKDEEEIEDKENRSPVFGSQSFMSPSSTGAKCLRLLQDQCFSTPPILEESFEDCDRSFELCGSPTNEGDISGMFETTLIKAPSKLPDDLRFEETVDPEVKEKLYFGNGKRNINFTFTKEPLELPDQLHSESNTDETMKKLDTALDEMSPESLVSDPKLRTSIEDLEESFQICSPPKKETNKIFHFAASDGACEISNDPSTDSQSGAESPSPATEADKEPENVIKTEWNELQLQDSVDSQSQPGPDIASVETDEPTILKVPARYFLDNRKPVNYEVRASFAELLGAHGGGMLPTTKQETIV